MFLLKSNRDFWATLPNNKLALYLLYLTYLYLFKHTKNTYNQNYTKIRLFTQPLAHYFIFIKTQKTLMINENGRSNVFY